ncbi:MAG: GNAT family N-acetyltransferase [Lachnospiraceae bacterium]|nr:GNAT family N-acetyltransferase [Lachnospiraceae bacterium]
MAEGSFLLPDVQTREVGWIGAENLDPFRSLLLPAVAAAIGRGEPITALGWVVGDTACGALAGYVEGGCFEIASFYVAPEWRQMGGGSMLLDELSELLADEGLYCRIAFSSTSTEQDLLEHFLLSRGFALQAEENSTMYQTSLGAADPAGMGNMKIDSGRIHSFAQTTDHRLHMEEKRALSVADILPQGGFKSGSVDPEVSLVYDPDGEITAYITIERKQEKLFVSSALNRSGKPQVFLMLLREALDRCIMKYGKEYPLLIPVTDDTSDAIVRRLFPGARQIMRVMEKTY